MKRFTIGVMVVVVTIVGVNVLKDEVDVIEHYVEDQVHPSENVVNHFGQLSVNGFDWISNDVKWLEEDLLTFSAKKGNEDPIRYGFNTSTLEVVEMPMSEEEVLDPLSSMDFDKGNVTYTSANGDKIGYLDAENKSFVAYDVSSDKKTSIQYHKGALDSLANMKIAFSDDGGFVSFSEEMTVISESRFSLLGADSGRYYGKEIKGIVPVFSPNSKLVAFIYSGDMQSELSAGKIGLFVLKYKKIVYLDSLLVDEEVFPTLAWSGDSKKIYVVTRNTNNQLLLNEIDVEKGSRKGFAFETSKKVSSLEEIFINGAHAYLVFDKGRMGQIDLLSGRYNFREGLLKFDDGTHLKALSSGKLLTFSKDALCLLSANGYKIIAEYSGRVQDIYLSENESKVCLLLEKDDGMMLQVAEITQ
jgi:hypothetical protein